MSSVVLQKILIFSLDAVFAQSIAKVLGEQRYSVELLLSLEDVIQGARTNEFNLAIFDSEDLVKLEKEGAEIFQEVNSQTPILLINPSPSQKSLCMEFDHNRCSFLSRPFSSQQVSSAVRSLLSEETPMQQQPVSTIIGDSEPMRWLKSLILRVAPLDSHVVIIGPSGSGKNLVADEIQRLSLRCKGPYIKIKCPGVPENLLYSDIFGDEKNEFKKDIVNTQGKLGLANNGTVLLDEIGELPQNIQARLVTALEREDGDHCAVGEPRISNFRIIVTSREDIPALVEDNKFREDLYFRLNFVSIHVPPLRQRLEDLPLLVESFLPRLNQKLGTAIIGVSNAAMDLLYSYHWPGNVRELGTILERAALFEDSNILKAQQFHKAFQAPVSQKVLEPVLPDERDTINKDGINLRETLQAVEKRLIETALLKTNGIQTQAAKLLGLTAKNLWKKMQKYEIRSSKLVSFPSQKSSTHVEAGSTKSNFQADIEPYVNTSQIDFSIKNSRKR